MQKWEYHQGSTELIREKIKDYAWTWKVNGTIIGKDIGYWAINNQPIVGYLNQLGKEGWELVSIDGGGTSAMKAMFFKRPKE